MSPINRFLLSNILEKSSVCNDLRKLYIDCAMSRSTFLDFGDSSPLRSVSNTSNNGRKSHSSSSDNFAIKSPSVVNNPVASSLLLMTISLFPSLFSSLLLVAAELATAKNGTLSFFLSPSLLLLLSSNKKAAAVSCSSFASNLARETANKAFACSNCFVISVFLLLLIISPEGIVLEGADSSFVASADVVAVSAAVSDADDDDDDDDDDDIRHFIVVTNGVLVINDN